MGHPTQDLGTHAGVPPRRLKPVHARRRLDVCRRAMVSLRSELSHASESVFRKSEIPTKFLARGPDDT
jgi:hypothetical protein